ncbi:MAG: hypothetical protein AB9897_07290 [Anaerolineaceae bacterium]
MDYWQKAQIELTRADKARQDLNEGMTRVCARRASGWAIKGYLTAKKLAIPSPNAFTLLNDPQVRLVLPQVVYPTIDHLTQRVNIDHHLPSNVELLQETIVLVKFLHNLCIEEVANGN